MITLETLKKYLNEATDLETLENDKLLILIDKKRIILNNISPNIREFCFEYFGKKFTSNEKIEKKVVNNYEWTNEEIHYLLVHCFSKSLREISHEINKTEYQIDCMIKKLNLFPRRPWTKSELDFMIENPQMKAIDLAGIFKRSLSSVKSKRRQLKLYME